MEYSRPPSAGQQPAGDTPGRVRCACTVRPRCAKHVRHRMRTPVVRFRQSQGERYDRNHRRGATGYPAQRPRPQAQRAVPPSAAGRDRGRTRAHRGAEAEPRRGSGGRLSAVSTGARARPASGRKHDPRPAGAARRARRTDALAVRGLRHPDPERGDAAHLHPAGDRRGSRQPDPGGPRPAAHRRRGWLSDRPRHHPHPDPGARARRDDRRERHRPAPHDGQHRRRHPQPLARAGQSARHPFPDRSRWHHSSDRQPGQQHQPCRQDPVARRSRGHAHARRHAGTGRNPRRAGQRLPGGTRAGVGPSLSATVSHQPRQHRHRSGRDLQRAHPDLAGADRSAARVDPAPRGHPPAKLRAERP